MIYLSITSKACEATLRYQEVTSLMQLLSRLNTSELELFWALFEYAKDNAIDLGYEDNYCEYVNELLNNHFGIEILDQRQLISITSCILDKKKLKAAHSTAQVRYC